MKTRRCQATLLACGSILCIAAGTLWAQDVPEGQPQSEEVHAKTQSEGAGAPEIIPHRRNPHESGAPTVGSTGVQTPNITYHGGPVMGTPDVYLIWYGNWNQSTGSDTPSGQQI